MEGVQFRLCQLSVHRTYLAVYTQALRGVNNYAAFDDANAHLSFAAVTVPKILDLDQELQGENRTYAQALPEGAPHVAIRFEEVAFRYPGAERPALSRLNLAVQAHRSLAIVGENGAGKTSLVKLLYGLYEPSSGQITVDGVGLSNL